MTLLALWKKSVSGMYYNAPTLYLRKGEEWEYSWLTPTLNKNDLTMNTDDKQIKSSKNT
jgi:hypothetical protein